MAAKIQLKELIELCKAKGFSSSELRIIIDIHVNGIKFTKTIYKFNELYEKKEIDGFPDSSIKVMEMFYGKSLLNYKRKWLIKKVEDLQRIITPFIDKQAVADAVDYYLGTNTI